MKTNQKKASKAKSAAPNQPPIEAYDILVDTAPSLSLENPIANTWQSVRLVLLIVASLAFTYSFASIYGIPTQNTNIGIGMMGYPVLFYLLYTYVKKRWVINVALLAGVGVFVATEFGPLVLGFKQAFNQCMAALSTRTFSTLYTFKVTAAENREDQIGLFMLLLTFFVIWVMAYSIMVKPNVLLFIGVSLALLLPGMAMGLVPTGAMFVLLLACYGAVICLYTMERKKNRRGKEFAVKQGKHKKIYVTYSGKYISSGGASLLSGICLLLVLAAFGVGGAIYNSAVYNSAPVADFRQGLYKTLKGDPKRRLMGINGGYLGVLETYEPGDKEALLMITAANMGNTLYIKNFVGATYTGSSWKTLSESVEGQNEKALASKFADKGYYPQNISTDFLDTYRFSNSPFIAGSFSSKISILVRSGVDYTRTYCPYNTKFPSVGLDGKPLEYPLDAAPSMNSSSWAQNYSFNYTATPDVLQTKLAQIANTDDANAQKQEEIVQIVYRQLEKEKYTKFFKITLEQVRSLLTQEVLTQCATAQGCAQYMVNYLKNHEFAYKFENEPLMEQMSADDFGVNVLPLLEDKFSPLFVDDVQLSQVENDFVDREAAYAEFVHKAYIGVPEKRLKEIKDEFGQILTVQFASKFDTTQQLIDYVRTYIWERCQYDTTNTLLPDGKDFVEYFLYDQGRGYSTLYASAATLIFRVAGVPARYCEGFVVQPKDFATGTATQVPILGTNLASGETMELQGYYFSLTEKYMHAWCEIYIDGYGWVPVEMTPGYENQTQVNPELLDDTRVGVVIPDGENGEDTTDKNPMDDVEDVVQTEYLLDTKTPGGIALIVIFAVMALICGGLCGLWLRRFVNLQKIKRQIHTQDYSKNVRNLYGYMMALLAASGYIRTKNQSYEALTASLQTRFVFVSGDQILHMVTLMQKSKFSDQPLSEQEYLQVIEIVSRMKNQISQSLSAKQKLRIAYGKTLL